MPVDYRRVFTILRLIGKDMYLHWALNQSTFDSRYLRTIQKTEFRKSVKFLWSSSILSFCFFEFSVDEGTSDPLGAWQFSGSHTEKFFMLFDCGLFSVITNVGLSLNHRDQKYQSPSRGRHIFVLQLFCLLRDMFTYNHLIFAFSSLDYHTKQKHSLSGKRELRIGINVRTKRRR